MNEYQESYEKVISLTELLFYCLKKWRWIVAAMLIVGALAGAYKYRSTVQSNQAKKEAQALAEEEREEEELLAEELLEEENIPEETLSEEALISDIDEMLVEETPEEEPQQEERPEKKKRRFWPFGRKRDEE